MTPWRNLFENPQLPAKLSEAIDTLQAASMDNVDALSLEKYSRLLKALRFIRGRLKSVDPELVSQTSLTNLGTWITTVAGHIQNFVGTVNSTYLDNANSTADSMLDVVRSFRVTPKADEQAIGAATAAFTEKAVEEIGRVQESRKEAISELAVLKRDITQAKSAVEESNKTIESQKARLDQSIAEFQKQFSQTEAKRAADFQTAVSKLNDDVSNQITEFDTQFQKDKEERLKETTELHNQFSEENQAFFTKMEERKKQVDEIFGAIGSASLAGHFKATADKQEAAANQFRWLALILMAIMVALASFAFYFTISHPTADWRLFVFRFATTLILAVPAFYAAKESARHRDRERHLRRSHLELASIDAYLALLPEDKRNELKEKLTEKFFGQSESVVKDDTVSGNAVFRLLETTIKGLISGK
jgi:hypothetical protein